MKNLKYVLSCLAVFAIAASFSGCSDDDSASSNDTEVVYYDDSSNSYVAPEDSEAIAKKNAVTSVGKINEVAAASGCDIIVKEAVSLGERPADEMNDYTADRIALEVEITNNTAETINISGMGDFHISVDGNSEIMGVDPVVVAVAAKTIDNFVSLDGDVEPGQALSGYITFEAKTGWKELSISYTPLAETGNYDAVVYTLTPDMITK